MNAAPDRSLSIRASRTAFALLLMAAFFVLVGQPPAAAGQQSEIDAYDVNAGHGLTFTPDKSEAPAPLAMRGYDPVSYFDGGKPLVGQSKYGTSHDGAIYWFVSAENRDRFKADPGKYAPRYGGFCAFGVTQQTKFDGDPLLWNIYDGKLYLNVTPDLRRKWMGDLEDNVKAADRIWPEIRDKQPQALFQGWLARQ